MQVATAIKWPVWRVQTVKRRDTADESINFGIGRTGISWDVSHLYSDSGLRSVLHMSYSLELQVKLSPYAPMLRLIELFTGCTLAASYDHLVPDVITCDHEASAGLGSVIALKQYLAIFQSPPIFCSMNNSELASSWSPLLSFFKDHVPLDWHLAKAQLGPVTTISRISSVMLNVVSSRRLCSVARIKSCPTLGVSNSFMRTPSGA